MLLSFEEGKAQDLINHAFSLYSVEKVVIDILGSLLVTVGDMWEKGQITSAHEHYTTQVLKTRISMIFIRCLQMAYCLKRLLYVGLMRHMKLDF